MLWKQPMTKVALEISVTFGPPPRPQVRDFDPVTPLKPCGICLEPNKTAQLFLRFSDRQPNLKLGKEGRKGGSKALYL